MEDDFELIKTCSFRQPVVAIARFEGKKSKRENILPYLQFQFNIFFCLGDIV